MSAVSRLVSLLLPLLVASCVNPGTPAEHQEKARQLSHDLQQLSPMVLAGEADRLALTAIEESAKLAHDFKPLRFPWMNNGLVNIGLRRRGLCYQWRDDLFPHLHRLNLKTLNLHLTSSRRATMREHNAIVVTANGQRFEDGLVIDPWRQGGRLWWGRLSADKSHPWKPLPRDLIPVVLRPLLMPELYPAR
ncbi:MAG: hypothetical protein ACKVY0_05695 [Prosthecobacter sp.]|uniref:hypothetical protein n=1 Tax=Prosthecobacter sp. TaxID=1965333 RepID=UPI00390008A8